MSRSPSRICRLVCVVGIVGLALVALSGADATAEVVRFEILEVQSPTFDGRAFGHVGQYEKIIARAFLAVDPDHPRNAGIVDLNLAPRNDAGRVQFVADVMILKPIDLDLGNRRILYGVVNRGRNLTVGLLNDAPRSNNPTTAADAGNGYMMREGYTLVWSGWQGDLAPGDGRLRLEVPIVSDVTGPNTDEFIFDHTDSPVVVPLSYPVANLDPDRATLTIRQHEHDRPVMPPGLSFEYSQPAAGGTPTPRVRHIVLHRPTGYDAGAIYEFTYPARDPAVMGLAFASTRDVVSFLRREVSDAGGQPNPLAPRGAPSVRYAYSLGVSQSGRFLRDFLYQGFNQDEQGRMVFEGIMPHVAGSRKTFTNARWAQPGRYSRQHETHLTPGDQFPFSYGVLTDGLTGKRDGIFARCLADGGCPKVIHTDTSTELWQARSSLVVTDTAGADIDLPPNVRAYLFGSAPHSGAIDGVPQPTPTCQHLRNPLHAGAPMRALLHALNRWQSDGVAPPASRYPSRRAGTLVSADPASLDFPLIPTVAYRGRVNELRVTNYTERPPTVGMPYPVYVAKIDADGNDVAGIRLPAVQVPRGTYLGWNQRRSGHAKGALCSTTGSYIPFAETRSDRLATGDPRLSVEERYPTPHLYAQELHRAVDQLVTDRLLLAEDSERMVAPLRANRLGR